MIISSPNLNASLCRSTFRLLRSVAVTPKSRHISISSTLQQNAEHTQTIFDRRAKRIQKERSAQRPDVALYDYIKDEVGFRLSDRIFDIKREFKTAADIGKNSDLMTSDGNTKDNLIGSSHRMQQRICVETRLGRNSGPFVFMRYESYDVTAS